MWKNIVPKQKLCGETLQQSKLFKEKNYKAKFLTIPKLKKKNSTKKILEKNMWKNTVAKQKLCGETLQQSKIFKKKTTKLNS